MPTTEYRPYADRTSFKRSSAVAKRHDRAARLAFPSIARIKNSTTTAAPASPPAVQNRKPQATCVHRIADIEEIKMPQYDLLFDPGKHLAFKEPPSFHTMQDIGYAGDVGISPMAVTQPFQLFSHEAIQTMRSEIFKPEVMSNYHYATNIASSQLRGYAREHAPFTYAAWNHPDTIAIVSKLAGIDLIPWSDYEIAHINLSAAKTEEQAKDELAAFRKRKESIDSDEGIDVSSPEDDKPIVGWHKDSYPFVCVLMLSDCTNMIGGETALRTADGNILRVRGPTEGSAVILQGRYITHQALRALGAKERITAVTSWRPRSPFVKDDSVLKTVRPSSDLTVLYPDFATYRTEIMIERLRHELQKIQTCRQTSQGFDTLGHNAFLQGLVDFCVHTKNELVPENEVRKGFVDTIDVPDVVVAASVETGSKHEGSTD